MKKHTKINTIKKKTAVKRRKNTVRIVKSDYLLWRHFKLLEHKHTFKLIHLRHTSHLSLTVVLVFLGISLFPNGSMTVGAITHNSDVTVYATVTGPPPAIGAFITSPTDGLELIDESRVEVKGTCPLGTYVVLRNNEVLGGSTVCDDSGVFVLMIELGLGENIISARDYDDYNQTGPVTPTVKVTVKASHKEPSAAPILPITPLTSPILPENPSIISGKDDSCDSYILGSLPISTTPRIAVVCVPRLFLPNIQEKLGILIWGGIPPYVVNIDWGGGIGEEHYNFDTVGYHLITFKYPSAGVYEINFSMTDKQNKHTLVQTAVQVNGDESIAGSGASKDNDSNNILWFETPVPLYVLAVALTLGFWGGDIFDRKFGYGYNHHRIKRRVT